MQRHPPGQRPAALPIWFIAIGSATKLAVNFVLVQIPSVGIKGAPMGTLVCFALVSVMELVAIKKVTPHPPKYLAGLCEARHCRRGDGGCRVGQLWPAGPPTWATPCPWRGPL